MKKYRAFQGSSDDFAKEMSEEIRARVQAAGFLVSENTAMLCLIRGWALHRIRQSFTKKAAEKNEIINTAVDQCLTAIASLAEREISRSVETDFL